MCDVRIKPTQSQGIYNGSSMMASIQGAHLLMC